MFWEFCPEDFEKVIKKTKYVWAEREKGLISFQRYSFLHTDSDKQTDSQTDN